MKDWIIVTTEYILSNWQTLLIGGVYAVSMVIFVLGCLKPLIKRWVKNTTLCKVIFAWLSIALNIPATAVSVWIEELPSDHFWTFVVMNAISTVLVYFVYENTALRNALHWFGKKTITLLFSKNVSPLKAKADIKKEAEMLLANPTGVKVDTPKSRYDNNIKI